jgi:hypothetical protein
LVYSLCFPFSLLIVNMYRLYSARSTSSSDGRFPRSFVRSDGVFSTFRTSGRVGSGFEVPRHGCSGFGASTDDRGFYYCLPPRHGGSGFVALWYGGSGFVTNLGEDVGFDGCLHDRGFDYSPPRHGYGGYGFEERGSRFDGNLGGGFGFDGCVPNRGINYSPTRHGHGGSGFAAPRRGDSGFDANFGGGPGFDGLDNEQRIQYSTYWRGGGGFDSPRLDPNSRRAGPFPFLTADGVPLDAGEDDSTRRWARIPLNTGEDLSTRRWPRIPLDASDNVCPFGRRANHACSWFLHDSERMQHGSNVIQHDRLGLYCKAGKRPQPESTGNAFSTNGISRTSTHLHVLWSRKLDAVRGRHKSDTGLLPKRLWLQFPSCQCDG